MKIHKLKLINCDVPVNVEFLSSNYFAITFPKHFLPFDYSMGTDEEITVYVDVYPDWTVTVGKDSNENTKLFERMMNHEGLVEGIRYLLFRGDLSARGGDK